MRAGLLILFTASLAVAGLSFMPSHVRQSAMETAGVSPHVAAEAERQFELFLTWASVNGPMDDRHALEFERNDVQDI